MFESDFNFSSKVGKCKAQFFSVGLSHYSYGLTAVPPIYFIGPPNGGSALRHGHHIEPVDFKINHGQASPCSFRRIVPPNTVQMHVDAGSVHVAPERR
jgi:hypothetical protein